MKKLYLVDVSSMFFRAFYAVRPLTSPAGLPTNAIYGFVSMIVKLLKDEKPDYLAFCYDRPEPSFRVTIDPNYKANRSETPEDLIPQIPYIKKIVTALGVPAFELEKFEADDLMGTFTQIGLENNLQVIIVSGDKDFAQLVKPHVILYDTMKDSRINEAGVFEKWGVRPEQFIDYLALVGDSSDNVPGVSGIGPKGAQKLLADFGSLDGIYQNIEQIKSASLKEKLLKDKENAYLSQKLVTIVLDAPLPRALDDLKIKPIHREELRSLLRELNFKTFEKNLLGEEGSGSAPDLVPVKAEIIDTKPNLPNEQKEIIQFKPRNEIELFVEEASEKIRYGMPVWVLENERGVALATQSEIFHLRGPVDQWSQFLSSRRLRWSGFDLKNFWRNWKVKDPICDWDGQLAAYVSLGSAVEEFQETLKKFNYDGFPSLPSGNDELKAHLFLQEILQNRLAENEGLRILQDIENPLSPVLLKMELKGVLIDTELLKNQSVHLQADLKEIEENIYKTTGEKFNIASPKQLAQVLFEKLKLPPGKKTKTGFSTDNDVLEGLKEAHDSISYILQYRELSKLKSTYVDALPALVDPSDHRVHTHFNQALTTTGRLSSTQPNLQNIPIKTDRGAAVRKAFIADQGNVLISLDYSQIELRILAHITADPGLCSAFADDLDIHTATASEIFAIPLKDVTSQMRRTAKAVNFGIAYGQGAFGLAETLGISRTESQDIIRKYFEKFSKVREYMDQTIAEAKEKGFVSTIFGRRRIMHELKSGNQMIRKFGERAAINAPIQGSAADIVKIAMLRSAEVKQVEMLLQVHDELIFEVSEKDAEMKLKEIREKMQSVCELRVPLKVNGAIGKNWDEAH